MKKYYLFILFCLCFVVQTPLFAQYILKVTVKDALENTPIPYTQIRINCLEEMFLSDINGDFSITINKDTCEVEFKQSIYEVVKKVYVFSPRRREIRDVISLQPYATRLEEAKVSASKYETKPEIATTSLVVLQPKQAENKNFVSVDNLVNTAGGIVVVDNEPQIRGGSGFSQGMGSRVMIMLDDMPLLRPDAGRPMWNFIPMESIEQVEIIKGAASVLFGSAALTGAINVLTAYPRSKPQTVITTFASMYDKPRNPYQTSWLHTNPVEYGLSFLHSRIIKKNFDLVVGGEIYNDQSYIGPEERISDTRKYNTSSRGKFDQRYRLNFASRYRFNKVKGLSVSLNGNFMYSNNAQSYVWLDADTNIYRTFDGALYQFKEFTFYLDPCVKYFSSKGSSHVLRNRVLYSNSNELTGSLDAQSMMIFDEYQFNKTIQKIGMTIVAGASNQYSTSYGPVFSGEGDPHAEEKSTDPSAAFSNNFAMYAQIEQKFFKNKNLTLQFGGRWEFYDLWGPNIKSEKKNKPIFRVGLNYQIFSTKTSLRASFGQGYRFPTIGEKFISLTTGNFGFYPNPQLKPETSWNAEVGIMQPFQVFGLRGTFDVCYFHQDYNNFIEFQMAPWGSSTKLAKRMGFKFINIGPAKVNGVDMAFKGEGKISKNAQYTFYTSYTWSNPTTKNPDNVYYIYKPSQSNSPDSMSFKKKSSDTTRKVLKYRIEHMVKLDLEFVFYKKFAIGGALNYYSSMRNVDKDMFVFDTNNPTRTEIEKDLYSSFGDIPFYNFYNYYQKNKKGSMTLDLRATYYFEKIQLSFIVKNLTNRVYSLRPLYAEPPRTFTLQLIAKI